MKTFLKITLIWSAFITVALCGSQAFAQQTAKVVASCGSATYTAGSTNYVTVDTAGNQCGASGAAPSGTQNVNITQVAGASVATGHGTAAGALRVELPTDGTGLVNVAQATASSLNAQVVGNAASGASDAGNPVKTGGVFNTALPTVTTGQRVDVQMTANGVLITTPFTLAGTAESFGNTAADAIATNGTNSHQNVNSTGLGYNGTSFDRLRTIQGGDGTGIGVAAISNSPNSSAAAAIVPVVSTALESCHLLKSGAGNLYTLTITIQATTGIVQLFNAITPPADGAVTPIWSQPVISNGTLGGQTWSWANSPLRGTTGLEVCFSSATTPFTKTASATAMFSAGVE